MADVRFGWIAPVIGVPESQHVPIVIAQQEAILPAVARHFDSVWISDHFYGFDRRTDPSLECWTTLTWLAARFPTLRLGTYVLAVGYRPPSLLAKMAATLQMLSGGRLVLGLGAGWRGEEYRAYGYRFPEPRVRVRQLDEAVQLIRLLWTETAPTFAGQYYEIADAYCPPRPAPPPPIMIGAAGESLMLPLVGRLADWWNVGMDFGLDAYRRKRDIVWRQAEAAGRDPAAIVLTASRAGRPPPTTADESARWLDELRPWLALGVTHVMLDFGHVASPEPVERFAAEVMRPLRADA